MKISLKNIFQWPSLALVTGALFLAACSSDGSDTSNLENAGNSGGQNGPLVKSASIFDISIRATANVDDSLVLHAAAILAEYLDNNEDGIPDNQLVVDAMVQRGATLVMARDSGELDSLLTQVTPTASWQDLLANETMPGGSANGRFDASYEEILHLITHVGYASVYPESFGEQPGSTLADAMDIARGGRFEQVPAVYPENAWYTYDDTTCEYDCQVAEYVYWALTSMLGAQDFPGRLSEIQQEWTLNTRALVQANDPAVYNLLSAAEFLLPTQLPDGNYNALPIEVLTAEAPSTTSDLEPNNGIDTQMVFGAASENACEQASANDAPACFIVNGTTALMHGVIDGSINTTLNNLLSSQSQVETIVMIDVPGSADDEANLEAGRRVYSSGLNTSVLSDSMIASGGVDFFLAGNQRSVETGAMIGVHSWAAQAADGSFIQGGDLPRDHVQHQIYIQYYTDINLPDPEGFYFYTLDSASAENIHYMSEEDIVRFGLATAGAR